MWRELTTAVWLLLMSVCDIRKRSVPVYMLWVGAIIAGAAAVCDWRQGEVQMLELCKALLPGATLLILAKVTDKAGCADGIILMELGIISGVGGCFAICMSGLILAAILSGVLLVLGKVGKNTRIPFIPFITAGWIIALCGSGGGW